ncbi:exopolyphosphatase [Pasteurellaceae bacterium HPA106]|uniref:exopolyphosphatase n=1 Tax=Spirabiliibacterium pneumoniae TaxID=221400 RepID=UPI001AAD944A|nr:exopolyphosphatase [Spirabiliibacterium pneumoniae]MBE2897067.1 exopolyphosphatase [Spirabiliibacterium pneumoniae]
MNNTRETATPMREFAAIDLGSNSFHMIIARIVNGSIQVLSRLKQRVQLAQGLDDNNHLSQAAIDRGVACLALFAERLQGLPAENIRTVGTYTLRQAVNKADFLTAAKAVFPYPINIISGEDEAKLIYSGVCHTQPESGRKLVVDIGGGSTEMIVGDGFKPVLANSRNMGCVSFEVVFFPNGTISRAQFERARQTALSRMADLSAPYRAIGWDTVLGSSGTVKTVSQIVQANFDPSGLITAEILTTVIERVLAVDHFSKINLKGLNAERASVFVPGLAILSALFENYGIEQMRYSDGALREGVMYGLEKAFVVDNIRERTIDSLMEHFTVDQAQALRVTDTAMLLGQKYACWANEQQAEELLNILFCAAFIHEIGLCINHKGVQKHSAYIIEHSDLPGFDYHQQHLLTQLVRFHIGPVNLNELNIPARYAKRDVVSLLVMLRLAIIINRSRQATEPAERFSFTITEKCGLWRLEFEPNYLARNPLTEKELKEEGALLHALGIRLEIA